MPPAVVASKGASEVDEIKGDWVLFHPVYTADELRAVEVSATAMLHRSVMNAEALLYR